MSFWRPPFPPLLYSRELSAFPGMYLIGFSLRVTGFRHCPLIQKNPWYKSRVWKEVTAAHVRTTQDLVDNNFQVSHLWVASRKDQEAWAAVLMFSVRGNICVGLVPLRWALGHSSDLAQSGHLHNPPFGGKGRGCVMSLFSALSRPQWSPVSCSGQLSSIEAWTYVSYAEGSVQSEETWGCVMWGQVAGTRCV
jgi:hypothetical protein